MTNIFIQERTDILGPVKAHWNRLLKEKEQHQTLLRASQVMLNAEEPSIRTYFCAKKVVLDYLQLHENDHEAFKELGKVHLFSCGGEETLGLAQEALEQSQVLAGNHDPEIYFLLATCHRMRYLNSNANSSLRHKLIRRSERLLKLALHYSPPSTHAYRFALADFYLDLGKSSKALHTLIDGFSSSADLSSDAEVFYQLGKFGIACADTLNSEGRQARAQEFTVRALEHFDRALQIQPDADRQWSDDMDDARRRVKFWQGLKDPEVRLRTQRETVTSDPGRNLRPPLTRLTLPFEEDWSQDLSETYVEACSSVDAAPIAPEDELLRQLLNRVENQAETYGEGNDKSGKGLGACTSRSSCDGPPSVDSDRSEPKHRSRSSPRHSQILGPCELDSYDSVSVYSSLCGKNPRFHLALGSYSPLLSENVDGRVREARRNSKLPPLAPASELSSEEIVGWPQTPTTSGVSGASVPTMLDQQQKSLVDHGSLLQFTGGKLSKDQRPSSCTSQNPGSTRSLPDNLPPFTSTPFLGRPLSSRILLPSAEERVAGEGETLRTEYGKGLDDDISVLRHSMRRLCDGVDRPCRA